jgi:hypothetical protein
MKQSQFRKGKPFLSMGFLVVVMLPMIRIYFAQLAKGAERQENNERISNLKGR